MLNFGRISLQFMGKINEGSLQMTSLGGNLITKLEANTDRS